MAMYIVNFKCGHKEEMEISEKARPEQRMEWMSKNAVCFDCYRKENEKRKQERLKNNLDTFVKNQQDCPKEFVDIINKNFWNLI